MEATKRKPEVHPARRVYLEHMLTRTYTDRIFKNNREIKPGEKMYVVLVKAQTEKAMKLVVTSKNKTIWCPKSVVTVSSYGTRREAYFPIWFCLKNGL